MKILEALGNIGFDWRVALANLVNFLIIFWILKKFAFGPIAKHISERQEKIKKGLEDAKKAEGELVMAKEKSDEIISKAKQEGNEVIISARDQEKSIVDQAHEKAEKEAEVIMKSAEEKISSQRSRMEKDVKNKAADLVVEGAREILKEEIDKEKGERLIKKLLSS